MPAVRSASLPEDVVSLRPLIEEVVHERVSDPDAAEDFVQETLARLLEVMPRLERRTLRSYAVVTARNLIVSDERKEAVRKRHEAELVDVSEPDDPESKVLQGEERAALRAAVDRLAEIDRKALIAHEVEGETTAKIAGRHDSSSGGVAVRLARARARLRVEYLLAFRRITPPSSKCRSVLMALSSGDRRRQKSLGASEHLLECAPCAALSTVLLERRRSLAGFAPGAALGSAWRAAGKAVRSHPVSSAVGAAGASAVAAVLVVQAVSAPAPPPPGPQPPAAPSGRLVSGGSAIPWSRAALARHSGRRVEGRNVSVHSVVADEGFWIGPSESRRIWVAFRASDESTPEVDAGETVLFTGRIVEHSRSFPRREGVTRAEGAALLARQGHHVVVHPANLETGGE